MKLKVSIVATAALLAMGCGSGDVTEDPTVAAAAAITDAQSTDVPLRLELMGGRPPDVRRWVQEGLQCDSTPTNTTVEVCGKSYPAEIHLDWSSCQLQAFRRGGRHGPPPAGIEGMGSGPSAGTKTSSGTVDVVSTTTATGECADGTELQTEQQSSHNIQHTTEDGQVVTISGTVTSSFSRTTGIGNRSQSSTFDTTRSRVDAEGNTIDSFHVSGTLESAFSESGETPAHTSKGFLTVEKSGESTSTVKLTDVVRVPRHVCDWPVSGQIERTADDITHVLIFGPECGQATLDGEAITLPSHPGGKGRHGGRRGPGGPQMGRGGPMGGG
jgi:hypothetical protein